jgi:hypothetical protein
VPETNPEKEKVTETTEVVVVLVIVDTRAERVVEIKVSDHRAI